MEKNHQKELYHLAAIVESSEDAIISKDLDSKIITWNMAAERIFGYSAEEIVGKDIRILFPKDKIDEEDGIIEKILKGNRVEHFDTFRVKKDGNLVPISITISPIKDSSENIIGVSNISRDISERVKNEERLREIAIQLNITESKFRSLVEAIADIVWMTDKNGTIIYSAGFEEWFKSNFGERVPSPDSSWINYIHKDDIIELQQEWSVVLKEKKPFKFKFRLNTKEEKWMESRGVPILDSKGEVFEWIGISTDITDEVLTQSYIKSAKEVAEEANRAKDRFLATLSHELRTPLVSILGYTNILESGHLNEKDREHALEVIARNAKLQISLIEDLLDINRIITGKIELNLEPVLVGNILNEVIETMRPQAMEKGITISTNLGGYITEILADKKRFAQIIINLLSNAIKFTPFGGNVSITRTLDEENNISISIRDTGIGIEKEFLPTIFQRFKYSESPNTRKYGGLGLGLSIVKQLIDMHRASINIDSEGVGKGTTATITFPNAKIVSGTPEQFKDIIKNKFEDTSLKGITLLVTDDDDDTRMMLHDAFTRYGANVYVASSAKEARVKYYQTKDSIDIMILDIGMPEEDGYSLLRSFRTEGVKTPAIALTAFTGKDYEMAAFKAGFQGYIAKPATLKTIIYKICEIVKTC